PLIRKDAAEREVLWVGRVAVIIIAIVAFMIASSKGSGAQAIMNLVENAWGIFGAAFGPVMILSFFWRRFNYKGAVCGVITGAAVDILWLVFLAGATGIYEILPGFAAGAVAAIIATLVSKAPDAEVTAIFDKATSTTFDD
ncbi:MAG: sodium:proline symporter, partial [Firmicutes bacterium]|nr:sodium:proline symporter [Bacillota bacterium]